MATEHDERTAATEEHRESARLPRGIQHVVLTLVIGVVIAAVAWYFVQPGGEEPASQAVSLTAEASGPPPKVGEPAPDFRLTDMSGNLVQLSDFRGQPVWITFWASWCPPCRAENPDIEATYQKYREAGLVVIAVDIGEETSAARGYLERTGLSFLVGLDQTTEVSATYRIVGIPTHYFVDGDGVLQEFRIGALSRKAMDEKVEKLLAPEGQ